MTEAKLKDLSKVSVIGTAASVAAATAESIAANIRDAILEHRLAPGAKLTEAQLCEVFDVKRGTVRLALAQLAVSVWSTLNRIVARSSQALRCRKCTKCSRCGESSKWRSSSGSVPGMARAGSSRSARRSDVNARRMKATISRRGYGCPASSIRSLRSLPATLCCANACRGLVARSTLISALYESLGKSSCSFEDHEHILAALDAGDAPKAAELMARHLQEVELKMLDRPARGAVDLREVFSKSKANERDKSA